MAVSYFFTFSTKYFANYNIEVDLQECIDVGTIYVGVFSEKKLVVFYLNGVLCHILYPTKYAPGRGYMSIEVGGFKRYVLSRNKLKQL